MDTLLFVFYLHRRALQPVRCVGRRVPGWRAFLGTRVCRCLGGVRSLGLRSAGAGCLGGVRSLGLGSAASGCTWVSLSIQSPCFCVRAAYLNRIVFCVEMSSSPPHPCFCVLQARAQQAGRHAATTPAFGLSQRRSAQQAGCGRWGNRGRGAPSGPTSCRPMRWPTGPRWPAGLQHPRARACAARAQELGRRRVCMSEHAQVLAPVSPPPLHTPWPASTSPSCAPARVHPAHLRTRPGTGHGDGVHAACRPCVPFDAHK